MRKGEIATTTDDDRNETTRDLRRSDRPAFARTYELLEFLALVLDALGEGSGVVRRKEGRGEVGARLLHVLTGPAHLSVSLFKRFGPAPLLAPPESFWPRPLHFESQSEARPGNFHGKRLCVETLTGKLLSPWLGWRGLRVCAEGVSPGEVITALRSLPWPARARRQRRRRRGWRART